MPKVDALQVEFACDARVEVVVGIAPVGRPEDRTETRYVYDGRNVEGLGDAMKDLLLGALERERIVAVQVRPPSTPGTPS